MVYGCTEDGDAEEEESEDDEEEIDSSSSEDEGFNQDSSLKKEQRMFTKCEEVFVPLMDRLQDAADSADDTSNEMNILACIDSMIQHIDLLTPPFLRDYPIIKLVLSVKASFEDISREVKVRCKHLRNEMKRVYNAKEKDVPDGFVPVKRKQVGDADNKSQSNNGDRVVSGRSDDVGEGKVATKSNREVTLGTSNREQEYSIGTAVVKQFGTVNRTGNITSFDAKNRSYRIMFSQGDCEELSEAEVSHLLLTSTAWFCIAAPTNGEETFYSLRVKAHRELVCIICKKKDDSSKNCLRIPVQCNVGDPCEFEEFKKYHAKSKKRERSGEANDGCTEAMHVGCARWGSDYAKVNNKGLRLCYYFSGQPPTYSGEDEYQNPVSNCFCRTHAREIQEGLAKDREGGGESFSSTQLRSNAAYCNEGSMSNVSSDCDESDDSTKMARQQHVSTSRRKKGKRIILDESDDGSD